MRVTLVTNTLAPYRLPQWNAMGRICDFTVVVLRRHTKARDWKISENSVQVPIISAENTQFAIRRWDFRLNLSYWSVARMTAQTLPQAVVISGYESPGFWAVLQWARLAGVPVVLWCETNALSDRTRGLWVTRMLKRLFIRRCQAFYTPSEFSARYLETFGVDPHTIVIGRNSCDSAKFPFYERLEDGTGPALLFVGQLIKRKGVRQMMAALDQVTDLPWRLKIAGTGPLMPELERWARQPKYAGRVEFLGYVQQERMSYIFRSADILLFPSLRDVYPLVILEALLNGLYIVGSDRSAVSFDMLKPGISGDIAPPGDPVRFGAAIRKALMSLPYDRRLIRSTVQDVTPEREAANMFAAVEIALKAAARSPDSAPAGRVWSDRSGARQ